MQMVLTLWSNGTENLKLVGQIVKKLLMEDTVVSKLPKLGESVVPRIHPLPQNYTHNLTRNYTFVFTPGYHKAGVHASKNTHKPTGTHMQARMQKRGRAGTQAHAGVHIHMRRLVRSRRQHARKHTSSHRCSRTHTCSHTLAQVRMHAHRGTHACSFT